MTRIHASALCRWCGGPFETYGPHWVCRTAACREAQLDLGIRDPRDHTGDESPWIFIPLPFNVDVARAPQKRLLVLTEFGVGKSFPARWQAYRECLERPGWRVLLLRNNYDSLYKNHLQFMPDEAARLGSRYLEGSPLKPRQMIFEHETANAIIFPGYCDSERDIAQHKGPEWDRIIFEEAGDILALALSVIATRDRGSAPSRAWRMAHDVDSGRSILLTNPGGPSEEFLRQHYIDRTPDPVEYPHYEAAHYGVVFGTLLDNPYQPPDFRATTLSGLDKDRYRQYALGELGVRPGAYFKHPPTIVGA